MKTLFRRVGLAIAAVVTAGVMASPAAAAESNYQPSDADFAGCPTLPEGAVKVLWNCVSVNLISGDIKLGSVSTHLDETIRINVAVGLHKGKLTTITGGLGGLSADAQATAAGPGFEYEVPVIGTIYITIEQAGDISGSGLIPEAIPLKVKLDHWLLGGNCYIGSNSDAIVIKPSIANARLDRFGTTPVVRADVSDTTFAVPGASGCGLGVGLMDAIVNSAAGVPSASGSNSVAFDTVVRLRNYALGNINPSLAQLNNATAK